MSEGEFVPESEIAIDPIELRVGGELSVSYGSTTGRVDIVLGRNPSTKYRTRFDNETGAGLKVVLRDKNGEPIRDMPRRAIRAKYSAGRWKFTDLVTGSGITAADSDDLRNLAIPLSNKYQLVVKNVSRESGQSDPRIKSFVFKRK